MHSADQRLKAHIATFGCQMNEYDSARMARMLGQMGYIAEPDPQKADLVIFNTCSVRDKAEQKLYSALGPLVKIKRQRDLIIGVTGCVAQQEGQRLLRRVAHLDFVLGTAQIDKLPELVHDAAKGLRRAELSLKRASEPAPIVLPPRVGLSANVTVMRGCDNFCSYCVVPYVRGREQSRPADQVLEEIAALAAAGAREIVLLGQNVDSYRDPGRGIGFAELLRLAAGVEGLWRVRFLTSHPKDLSPELIETLAAEPKVMEQMHLPIQSGDDAILAAMNRGYTTGQYLAKVEALRRAAPRVTLGGDIIVGFPGESEDAFARTLELVERVGYDTLFCFIYSDRPFTKASRMTGKIDQGVKASRVNQLLELHRRLGRARNRARVGTIREVLVEGPAKKGQGMLAGRDRGGLAVNFAGEATLVGTIQRVLITQGLTNSLIGRLADQPEGGNP